MYSLFLVGFNWIVLLRCTIPYPAVDGVDVYSGD